MTRWAEDRDLGDMQREDLVDSLYFEPPDAFAKQRGFWTLLVLSAVLFALGAFGVLWNRGAITILMCVELMLNAVNLTLVVFSRSLGLEAQVLVFFVMAVAAAEAAVGLAIIAVLALIMATVAFAPPDFFLFDDGGLLVYRGQLDDSRPGNSIPVTGRDLRAALDAVLAGKPVPTQQKPSIGCNIKWRPGNEPEYFNAAGIDG